MKLRHCEAYNFGSYERLDFDFSSPGLSLIYGRTGSGKSMLADLPCWTLYGITAKNAPADSVRSWQAPDQPTKSTLDVELQDGAISVTRIRGRGNQNDLYWVESQSDEKRRGKDLLDTQRLLDSRLGVDSTLYLSACYFCDFSPSGSFFVDKAPARRELFEKIAPLELPVKISERASDAKKAAKKELEVLEIELAKILGKLEQLTENEADLKHLYQGHEDKRLEIVEYAAQISQLDDAIEDARKGLADMDAVRLKLHKAEESCQEARFSFRAVCDKQKRLASIGDRECPLCMAPQKEQSKRHAELEELADAIEIEKEHLSACEAKVSRLRENMQGEVILRDKLQKNQTQRAVLLSKSKESTDALNPHQSQLVKIGKDKHAANEKALALKQNCKHLEDKIARLARLYDLSFELRGALLKKAVKEIEVRTNGLLAEYFDAELRVAFSVDTGDNIEVVIQKAGFQCLFKQLSKGQRQLLKLCFSVSIMETTANAAGVSFGNVFMDEPTDGLDSALKVKAFSLFENIASRVTSVFIIEHASELQIMFSNKHYVSLDNDCSTVKDEIS